MEIIVFIILVIVGVSAAMHLVNQARRKKLMEKYGDVEVVDMIMKKMVWQGMSADHLIDSLGRPAAIDRKVYKTKTTETYKYHQAGKNRFRSRVTLENGSVVGWDMK